MSGAQEAVDRNEWASKGGLSDGTLVRTSQTLHFDVSDGQQP